MECMPGDGLVPRVRETKFFRRNPMAVSWDLASLILFCFLLTIGST